MVYVNGNWDYVKQRVKAFAETVGYEVLPRNGEQTGSLILYDPEEVSKGINGLCHHPCPITFILMTNGTVVMSYSSEYNRKALPLLKELEVKTDTKHKIDTT